MARCSGRSAGAISLTASARPTARRTAATTRVKRKRRAGQPARLPTWTQRRPSALKAGISIRGGAGPPGSEFLLALVERLVMLDARDAQSRHAGAIDGALPAGKFLEAETVAL